TDGPVRAQRARALLVLRAKVEVAGEDALGRAPDPADHELVVGRDVPQLAAAHVEQDEARIATAWKEAPASRQAVDPQLQRVGLDQGGVERRVRLEVDEGDLPIDLAHAVDDPADTRAADRHVEAGLDRERAGKREWMREI